MTSPRLAGRSLFRLSLLVLLFASTLNAQQPAATATSAQAAAAKTPDFSREAVVVEKQITRIREEADGTGTRELSMRARVQADAGVKQLAVLAFTYTAGNQQVDIAYVRVLKPDGTVVVTPDYNVQDLPADVTREAPMYSDIHQKHVAVKGLGVGDTLEYKLTLRTTKPEVPGQFWLEYSFQKDLVVQDEELELDVPAEKQVKVASADVQPSVSTAAGRKIYRWTSANLSRPDPDAPRKSQKHWKPSVQVSTFSTWQQVGAWYASLQNSQVVVTPAIQARADALTKGLTTPEDKIRAIFDSVALHTHYVGLEFGIGRYQPHPADDVLSNEYGDCKDKHTLVATLLKAAGIEAWPALISSGRELDADMPSPGQFDHVITVVPRDGKLVWMDSTAEVLPVGVLFANLRDKQALVVPNGKPARLERTAETLPYPQETRFETVGKLSDAGLFQGRITQTYRGDGEFIMRAAFRSVSRAQWKEFVQNINGTLGFGGDVKEPEVSPIEKNDGPLHLAYDYTREKFGRWNDRRIVAALPPTGLELMPGVKVTKPGDDVELGSPGETVLVSKIELPAGYVSYPPKDVHLKENWAEYDASYSEKDHTLFTERRLRVKSKTVPLADWDKYLDFRRAIYADNDQTIPIATQSDRAAWETSWSSNGSLNYGELQATLKPLAEAEGKLAAENPPNAEELTAVKESCRKAVAEFEAHSLELNPADRGALVWAQVLAAGWTALGWAEMRLNDAAESESHLRSAWELSHAQSSGYLLGQLLEKRGSKTEAEKMYQLAMASGRQGVIDAIYPGGNVAEQIQAAYKRLKGAAMSTNFLGPNGAYKGSVLEQLNRTNEIPHYVPVTKLTGTAHFSIVYETGKPVKAQFMSGDEKLSTLAHALETGRLSTALPAGAKARVVRQARLICSPYGGCDAYLMLPTRIEDEPRKLVALPVNALHPEKQEKVIRVAAPPK